MRSYLISDNVDTLIGIKLAGIEGRVVHEREDALKAIGEVKKDKDIGIIILTEKIASLIEDELNEFKLSKKPPLFIEIPDRHGSDRGKDWILKYVRNSIGLNV